MKYVNNFINDHIVYQTSRKNNEERIEDFNNNTKLYKVTAMIDFRICWNQRKGCLSIS